MKKIKKIILTLLLFTFAFISVHDYAMIDTQEEISYKAVYLECVGNDSTDLKLHLHESLHTLLTTSLDKTLSIVLISPYQKQFESNNLFISQTDSVLQRPPLS